MSYEDGEAVVNEGEYADAMYVIRRGEVLCTKADNPQMRLTLRAGALFGESALKDDLPVSERVRRASVRADGEGGCTLLKLTEAAFRKAKSGVRI